MDPKELWGKHIIALRKRHNLSQEEMADSIGTDQATISRWERFLFKPAYRMQKRIASLYGDPLEPSDCAPLETVYEIAQRFVEAQNITTLLFDRELILRAKHVPNPKITVGMHMSEISLPEERPLVPLFEKLLDDIGFWETPNACWMYHMPDTMRGGNPLKLTVRFVLTSMVFGNDTYLLINPPPIFKKDQKQRTVTHQMRPEPFIPRSHEIYIPRSDISHLYDT